MAATLACIKWATLIQVYTWGYFVLLGIKITYWKCNCYNMK